MTLVESQHEFEITKKSLEDDVEIKEAVFNNVPLGFIETFVLKNPGNFSICKTPEGVYYLSILPGENKSKKENSNIVHLRIDHLDKELGIHGMLFARAKTLGQLIYNLKNENIDILAGVLDENLAMSKLLGPSSTKIHNIHQTGKYVKDKNMLARGFYQTIYTGEMKFSDGKIKTALFEELTNVESNHGALKIFFEKLINGKLFSSKNLPIRLPIGAILSPPTLIYEYKKSELGMTLDEFMKRHDNQLDLGQRIKLCSSLVRIMSELHHSEIFHGAVRAEHFYVEVVENKSAKIQSYEIVFNGSNGLLIAEKSENSVRIVDYDLNAPEVAFTRQLTKESGVFNLGRLFEQILKTDIMKSYKEPAQEEPRALHEMRRLIARATRPNPQQRPTMHGIVMLIRDIVSHAPPSTSHVNIVHYDQFPEN